MANYSLVVNSQFHPFSYAELIAPVMEMSNYHEKLNAAYEDLSKQADILSIMGNDSRDKNSNSYNAYKTYSDSLKKERDELYEHGLTTESRNRLTNLRSKYNSEIVPIQTAFAKREQEANQQMNAYLQNPTLMFTRDASRSSIDEYIANPSGGYGVINGANITAQMSQMAKNLEKEVRNGTIRRESLDPFTYDYIVEHGLDANMIRDWKNNPTLSKMFEQVMRANGVTPEALQGSLNAQSIIDKSTGYAEMGMWNAIGQRADNLRDNRQAIMDAEEEKQRRLMEYQANIKNGGNEDPPTVTSVDVNMEPTEKYKSRNLKALNSLKAGNDGVKSAYFGKTLGKVNPMKIYKEYKEALKNTGATARTVKYSSVAVPVTELGMGNANKAKELILKKYRKYGVTDILSDEQYNALKSIGYSEKSSIGHLKFSTLLQGLNKQVVQKSSYSTNMADYETVNEKMLPNLRGRAAYGKDSGTVWAINKNGTRGDEEEVEDLNLYSKETNAKGNTITDVRYNPRFKGKIVIQLSDGTLHITDPTVYDSNLANMIELMESNHASPKAITMAITTSINERNKVKSKTDSKIE